MARVKHLRDGKARSALKVVSRQPKNVKWFRQHAKSMNVSQGALFDTLVDLAQKDKSFRKKVEKTWRASYEA